MSKVIVSLIIVALAALIGVFTLIVIFGGDPGLSSEEIEGCNVLLFNDKEATDLVFFGETKREAEEYMRYFLGVDPFDEHGENFNFYYIGNFKPECDIYRDVAILCYSKELIKKSSACPTDHIIVLDGERDRSVRSSNYLNVMSINTKHPKSVFIHEFGHSFVNLAEEYVPANIPRNSAGNCVNLCNDFDREIDGCFEGCSKSDFIRSIENGVMRTLWSDKYGMYNEAIIVDKINNLREGLGGFSFNPTQAPSGGPTGFVISEGERDCSKEEYYLIEGDYDLDTLKKSVETGCYGGGGSGGYSYDVVLDDKTEIFIGEFNPENIFTSAPGEDEIDGEVYDGDGDFILKAPIIEGAEILEVKDMNKNIVASVPICEKNKGDANGDGIVDIGDVKHINNHLILGNVLACRENADFNSDGEIDDFDLDDLVASIGEGESNNGFSEVCGNGIIEEGEICEIGDVDICEVDGGSGTKKCLDDCSGFSESCNKIGSSSFTELFYENCNSVSDWNVEGGWIGFNGECFNDEDGESKMVGTKVDVSGFGNVKLSFDYDVNLSAGERFKVNVNGLEMFKAESVSKGKEEISLNISGEIIVEGVCFLNVNSTGYCKWDEIKVNGNSGVEELGFFGRITGFFARIFD